jgi:hypothetical protein
MNEVVLMDFYYAKAGQRAPNRLLKLPSLRLNGLIITHEQNLEIE